MVQAAAVVLVAHIIVNPPHRVHQALYIMKAQAVAEAPGQKAETERTELDLSIIRSMK